LSVLGDAGAAFPGSDAAPPSELPADLRTPCVLVDATILRANLEAMATQAQRRGLALRPHAKTHKCLQIAHSQLALGAAGLTVATVGEAETFADAGVADLFIAYPIWADADRGRRLRALADRVVLRVGVESREGAALLGRALGGTTAEAIIEIDSGHHRTGVAPPAAAAIAQAVAAAGMRVGGIFTFPGHGYGPQHRVSAAVDEAHALSEAAQLVESAGFECAMRSGGSTPTAALAAADVLTELRPGVYVFHDAQQVELGAAAFSDVALVVASTVVSRSAGAVVLDAGSKVLGADRAAWASGFGRLPDHPAARITALSEHHATVTFIDGDRGGMPDLGDVVRVVPNHVCSVVNLADELLVIQGGAIVDSWPVAARGRNT
jgi:D-serine deaminase-like pyridoxal phosphate-dependent protein